MTPIDLVGLFRERTEDTAAQPLWSDPEIYEYIDAAQNEACRRAHLLVDSRSDLTIAPVTAGDPAVPIDPRIIHIRRARRGSDSMPLVRKSVRDMDQCFPGWEGQSSPSTPSVFIPDWEVDYLRVHPVPVIDDEVLMTIVRMPLKPVVDKDSKLEISARYHRDLLNWMLFLGYSKADPETKDDKKAAAAEKKFIESFGEKSSAADERWAFEQYLDQGEL